MHNGLFGWDDDKNELNIKKHGFDFWHGVLTFEDQNYLLFKDRVNGETGEQRWNAFGLVNGKVLVTTHVYRPNLKMPKTISPTSSAHETESLGSNAVTLPKTSIEQALAALESSLPMLAAENTSSQVPSIRFSLYHEAEPLADGELDARGLKPARDYPYFRFWQDRHNPERVATFEESRRRWHERNDRPTQR